MWGYGWLLPPAACTFFGKFGKGVLCKNTCWAAHINGGSSFSGSLPCNVTSRFDNCIALYAGLPLNMVSKQKERELAPFSQQEK